MKALVYAKEKVWVASDGKTLVSDGDPDAAILVSRRGAPINSSRLARFENAEDYFGDDEPKPLAKAPKTPDHMTIRMGKRIGATPKEKVKEDPNSDQTAESVAALVEAAQESLANAKTAKDKAAAKKALKAAEKAQADFEALSEE